MSDTKISLSGMARELGGREAIAAALTNLPEGFTVASNEIKAPPYIFQANKDPVALTLTLTGYVPDNNVHAAIVAAAGRKFFSEKVVDNLKASLGAPSGFRRRGGAGAWRAVAAVHRDARGVGSRSKAVGRCALRHRAWQLRADLVKDFPQGWQLKADISVKPAAAPVDATVCQQLFSELLAKGTIRFQSGRSNLDLDSAGPARSSDRDCAALSDHQYRGRRTYRYRRRRRHQPGLVRKARPGRGGLSGEGRACPAGRFTAIGYGSTQPVAANDTDDGKARNRRIEFIVKEQP